MKIAIVGSRSLQAVKIGAYLKETADEILSGGARGVDRSAAEYAKKNEIKLTEILPEYARFGRAAPIIRNKKIVELADKLIVFWDGCSKGTLSVILYAKKLNKPLEVIICSKETAT